MFAKLKLTRALCALRLALHNPKSYVTSMRPWILHENTLTEFRTSLPQVVVLPIGSTEAHGPHVPYGSDTFHSRIIAERVDVPHPVDLEELVHQQPAVPGLGDP